MEFDNQGVSDQWKNGARPELSEFSDAENNQGDKKNKKEKTILGAMKKDKEKKKEKETRYATLGDDSSGDEEARKKAKKKGFQFGSTKKEKKEKKESGSKEVKESRKKEKKDKEREKDKDKLKNKSKKDGDIEGKLKVEEAPVFGVPLSTAVERSRCHDGIKLPVVVRECIDFIEEYGLKVEGIYRSSGVKSKVNKLKVSYNTRQSVSLAGSEPAVVASLLKLFLRELPDPVLTLQLSPRFEEVCETKDGGKMLAGLAGLVNQLPECNRTLLEWIFVHMDHVIQHEKQNKMSLQNVSIVLSPTMQISHRVLYCLFKHSIQLFGHVIIRKYIPPISGQGGVNFLPESPEGIEEEMKKQESLLEDLHKEISRGVASKAAEEQLWEQQRIVTQLKRKLRLAKSSKNEESKPDPDEELNFSLQKPVTTTSTAAGGSKDGGTLMRSKTAEEEEEKKEQANQVLSSPEEKDDANGQEHRVTVQIHQSEPQDLEKGHVTVIKLAELGNTPSLPRPQEIEISTTDSKQTPTVKKLPETVFKTPLPRDAREEPNRLTETKKQSLDNSSGSVDMKTPTEAQSNQSTPKDEMCISGQLDKVTISPIMKPELMEPMKIMSGIKPHSTNGVGSEPKPKKVDFKPDTSSKLDTSNLVILRNESRTKETLAPSITKPCAFPLLPPPPTSSKPSSRSLLKPAFYPQQEVIMKSKSLPRGLPSDPGYFTKNRLENKICDSEEKAAASERELLIWEELRLKIEYEELLNLKSELERKRKTERREINELQEEIATMQTLYQYRTYSIDSSEDSDVEQEEYQVKADNRHLLRQLSREQSDLEQKKLFLLTKLETERRVCLQLRVQIRLEQERLKRKGL